MLDNKRIEVRAKHGKASVPRRRSKGDNGRAAHVARLRAERDWYKKSCQLLRNWRRGFDAAPHGDLASPGAPSKTATVGHEHRPCGIMAPIER